MLLINIFHAQIFMLIFKSGIGWAVAYTICDLSTDSNQMSLLIQKRNPVYEINM